MQLSGHNMRQPRPRAKPIQSEISRHLPEQLAKNGARRTLTIRVFAAENSVPFFVRVSM